MADHCCDKLVNADRGLQAGRGIYRRPFSRSADQCRGGSLFDLSRATKGEWAKREREIGHVATRNGAEGSAIRPAAGLRDSSERLRASSEFQSRVDVTQLRPLARA